MPSSNEVFCELLIALLLPPLAVCLKQGYYSVEFCKCLLLTILGYVPGIIYAIYTIVFVDQDDYKLPLYHSSNQSSGTECNRVEAASVGADEGNLKNSKKKDGGGVNKAGRDDSSTPTPPRFAWTDELHRKFVAAVNILGDKAVPKRILELMDVPGLTRSKVASHLRKYRMYLRCQSGESPQPSNPNNSFMYQQTFGPVSSVKELDLQELATSDQPPAGITIEHLLPHSTTMESHPIGNIHIRSSRINSPLMQLCQPQSRRQMPNGIGVNVYTRNGMQENILCPGYNPVPQASSMPNFPRESCPGTPW